jgi:hypothetical protein
MEPVEIEAFGQAGNFSVPVDLDLFKTTAFFVDFSLIR